MSSRRAVRAALLLGLLVPAVHCTATGEDDSEAIAVAVGAESAAAPREIQTDAGLVVTMTRALVAIETVEIVGCGGLALAPGGGGLLEGLGLVGVAHAHSAVEPTKTGTPVVLPATGDGAAFDLDTLKPPPGRYCTARITFGPADGDAEGMPDDGAMVGRTLLVEGTAAAPGDDPAPFRLTSAGRATAEVPIDLTLGDGGAREASVRAVIQGHTLLDGVDVLADDGEVGGAAALERLRAAASARVP